MIKRIQFLAILTLFSLSCLSAGCAQHAVQPSGPRPPTSAEQVKIYQKEPNKYEDLGMVTVPVGGAIRMDDRGDATPGFVELKKRAAAMGANGLLLDDKKVESQGLVTAGYNGTFYQVPIERNPKMAKARAIWVIDE